MTDEKEATRQKILKKLSETPDPNNVIAVSTKSMKEEYLEKVGDSFSEEAKELWFPSADVKVNLEKITADLRDTDHWKSLFKELREGKISDDDMADYVVLSHLSISDEPNPLDVHYRQVEDGLKSRIGAKLLGKMVEATNLLVKSNAEAIMEALPLEHKPDIKLLTTAEEVEGKHEAVLKQSPEMKQLATMLDQDFLGKDYQERMVREFFAGDILYDQVTDLTFEKLLEKLSDPDDYEFDNARNIIVDAGMEQLNKAALRTEYDLDTGNKTFVVYTVRLANIFDGFGGTHSDDRGVVKYRCKDKITEQQFTQLTSVIKHRYHNYINGRKEFSEMVMRWKTREQVRTDREHPFYNGNPDNAFNALTEIINIIGTEGTTDSAVIQGVIKDHFPLYKF
jgi:hypothetical protein